MEAESLDHTGFLLQRLQELKNWQRQQEEQLLQEQNFQIEQIFNNDNKEADIDSEDDDDDKTTNQDLSSLHSEEVEDCNSSSLPSWASQSLSSTKSIKDHNPDDKPIQAITKTFEELLLDNLTKEEMSPSFANNDNVRSSSGQKAFLRRRSGLARYRLSSGSNSSLISNINSKSQGMRLLKTSVSCPNVASGKPPKKSIKKTSTVKLKPQSMEPQASFAQKEKAFKEMINEDGLDDSVELSFMGKLEKAEKKDSEDLRAFELLEEAALDSSFCSTSSKVRGLMANNSMMPSPIPKRSNETMLTPEKENTINEDTDEILMKDIHAFLQQKGAILDEDDKDDITLINDDADQGIVRDVNQAHQLVLNGDDNWSSDNEGTKPHKDGRKKSLGLSHSKKNVHFRDEELSFSPPRVPRHSPSYLIWSIFTKEREERRMKEEAGRGSRKKAKSGPSSKKRSKSVDRSPMSTLSRRSEHDFEATMLNAKLAELRKEVEFFQKENASLNSARRKLAQDRKQLAKDVQEFEASKELEKKKLDEEKKRLKRDKTLLEKSIKDKKANLNHEAIEEVEELQGKVQKLTEELQRKEAKWGPSLSKLQEQIKILGKENQLLHEENHKLKMKTVSSKVSTRLIENPFKTDKKLSINDNPSSSNAKLDFPDAIIEMTSSKSLNSQQMSFSPAESLDSDMTLVSSSLVTQKTAEEINDDNLQPVSIAEVKNNEAKGTTEKIYSDGSIEIVYSNGNRKDISSDGKTTKVYYYNGDIKEKLPSGLLKYFYSQTQTWHLTYLDGKEVLQFNNGQEEIRYPNGTLQISFSDGSVKRMDVDGTENINFPDGTKVIVAPNGDRTLLLPNGQKEIHTSTFKQREYPDGTVKILHDDGKLETRYSTGRVRIKDGQGQLLHDSGSSLTNLPIKV